MKAFGIEAIKALKKSEKKYRQLVEDANSIILRMDTKGNLTFLNKFALKFFGYKENEILGRHVIGTIVPDADFSGRDLKSMIDDIMRHPDRYVNNENENMLHDGQRVWIAWTNKAVFDNNDHHKEILCVGNDITKIKKSEELLKEMDKRKSDFVANVSHEFRSPLGIMQQGLAQVLDGFSGKINARQREMLEIAKRSVDRLTRLVADLLDIARIESGKMELKIEQIKIVPLVNEIIANDKIEISKRHLILKKHMNKNTGALQADKDKLTEVIMNLLSNAIKYTPSGGEIIVRLQGERDDVRFEISDSGPGIAKKDISKLFDKFERIKAEKQEGTGLGLAICKSIIDLHKGRIWAESDIGKGSKFIFTLPRKFKK